MSHIKLSVTPAGRHEVIEVDGHNLAPACRGYTLRAAVDEVARLELELALRQVGEVEGEAVVEVDEWTRKALVALGWTPPA